MSKNSPTEKSIHKDVYTKAYNEIIHKFWRMESYWVSIKADMDFIDEKLYEIKQFLNQKERVTDDVLKAEKKAREQDSTS
jgi:hypothetical protein